MFDHDGDEGSDTAPLSTMRLRVTLYRRLCTPFCAKPPGILVQPLSQASQEQHHQPSTPLLLCEAPHRLAEAEELASLFGLTLAAAPEAAEGPYLALTDHRLELRPGNAKKCGPVFADFSSHAARLRRSRASVGNELLARAAGLRKKGGVRVLDATGGLGADSFLLAWLGCRVEVWERSPVVCALLLDGLNRAKQLPTLEPVIRERLSLRFGDSRFRLRALPPSTYQVVYLDPMYQDGGPRKSLPRKEMQLLKEVAGPDSDADELLVLARGAAAERVVVKRQIHAAPLGGMEPDLTIRGRSTRFDIYLTKKQE